MCGIGWRLIDDSLSESSSDETLRSVPYSVLVPRSTTGLSSVSDLRLAFNWQMIDGLVKYLFSAIFIIFRLLTELDIFDKFVDCFTSCTNWTVLRPSTILTICDDLPVV